MIHPTLGELIHDPNEEAWIAFAALPGFAARFVPGGPPPAETISEIRGRLETLAAKIANEPDAPERTAQEDFDDWSDSAPPTRNEIRGRTWDRWMAKWIRVGRSDGSLPVWLETKPGQSPGAIHERALQHLRDRDAEILAAVWVALKRARDEYSDYSPGVAGATDDGRIGSIRIHDEGHDDIAPVRFGIACDWEHEHGIAIVYHPRTGADWTSADGADDLMAAACPEPPPPPPPTPEEELVAAIFARDAGRVRELRDRGVRANPPGPSALFGAIYDHDVEMVRQLLSAGADPNARDSYEGTPMEAARRALAVGTLKLSRAPWWLKVIIGFAKLANARHVRKARKDGEAILRMLREAGGN